MPYVVALRAEGRPGHAFSCHPLLCLALQGGYLSVIINGFDLMMQCRLRGMLQLLLSSLPRNIIFLSGATLTRKGENQP